MQKIKFLLLCTFFVQIANAQNYTKLPTYTDAVELAQLLKLEKSVNSNELLYDRFWNLLKKYGITNEQIGNNIFLKDISFERRIVLSTIFGGTKDSILPERSPSPVVLPKTNTADLGKLISWQSSAINGVSNYMAGRFKQEVLHIAIDQMFSKITAEKDQQFIEALFPKSFAQISMLKKDGIHGYYAADLVSLKYLAAADLKEIESNLVKHFDLLLSKNDSLKQLVNAVKLGAVIFQKVKTNFKVEDILVDIIEALPEDKFEKWVDILKTADLLLASVRQSVGAEQKWLNVAQQLRYSNENMAKVEVRFFYGLLYEQLKSIPEVKQVFESLSTLNEFELVKVMHQLLKFVDKINTAYDFVASKNFSLKDTDDLLMYSNHLFDAIGNFLASSNQVKLLSKFEKITDKTLAVFDQYKSFAQVLSTKDYAKIIPLLYANYGNYLSFNLNTLRKLNFLTDLVTVNSAKEMEEMLQSYALPIGSASIKRNSNFNLSLNGYVGLTYGSEKAYGSISNQVKNNVGLSAPIGLSTTFAKGTTTMFVSFVDLGSIVNQRLNNDTVSYTNLRFEHFFNPGLGLFYNFKKLPISTGLHFSYIPNLRTIKYQSGAATITEANRSVTRLNWSLLVDLPFFTLANRK